MMIRRQHGSLATVLDAEESQFDDMGTVDWRLLEDVEATSSFCAPWRTDEDD